MKDIGSIFPLFPEDLEKECIGKHDTSGTCIIRYSLCREALGEIAKNHSDSNRIVLLPAYTCQTVIDPFGQNGWECEFYNITQDLRIDIPDLFAKFGRHRPELIVVHPYLGMEFNSREMEALKLIREDGGILIEDLTQCIFSNSRPSFFSYFVGSYRKWAQVPDGGFLQSVHIENFKRPAMVNNPFVVKQTDAMILRGEYLNSGKQIIKDISIRLNKEASDLIKRDNLPHRMADLSASIWSDLNMSEIAQCRMDNYRYLYENIRENRSLTRVCKNIEEVTTSPLYFALYIANRKDFLSYLYSHRIYAPVLWPVDTKKVLINRNIEYIYDSILMLPIDQRYDEDVMRKIAFIINQYGER